MRKGKIAGTLLLLAVFLFSVGVGPALAEAGKPEPNVQVEAGVTPDSPFYFLDLLAEKVKLFFTTDPKELAETYARLALERMAEAQEMTEAEKTQYLEKLVDEYATAIQNAREALEKALAAGAQVKEVAALLDQAENVAALKVVLEKVPGEGKERIKLRLLENVAAGEVLKVKLAKAGVEVEEEKEQEEALEAILGEFVSSFVQLVNDARQEVHEAVVAKEKELKEDEKAREELRKIEKDFRGSLREIEKDTKIRLVEMAKQGSSQEAMAAVVKEAEEKIKAQVAEALAAIQAYTGAGQQDEKKELKKKEVKNEKKEVKDEKKEVKKEVKVKEEAEVRNRTENKGATTELRVEEKREEKQQMNTGNKGRENREKGEQKKEG